MTSEYLYHGDDMCSQHFGEAVKFYCGQHDQLACSACVSLNHQGCKLDFIPLVSSNITDSQEFKSLEKKLDDISERSAHIVEYSKANIIRSQKYQTLAMDAVKDLRKDMEDRLEQLEKYIMKATDDQRHRDCKKMAATSKRCGNVVQEAEEIKVKLKELKLKDEKCKLFITMKTTKEALMKMGEDFEKSVIDDNITEYKVCLSQNVIAILKNTENLAELCTTDPKLTKAVHVTDIDIHDPNDQSISYISGVVLIPDNRLVICDSKNNKVKLIDIKRRKAIANMKLSSSPNDAARIGRADIVVTLPRESKVLMMNVAGEAIAVKKTIRVNGACHGIIQCLDRLVISYLKPGKVEIMNMEGEVLQRIATDRSGRVLFHEPRYVAVSPDQLTVYVSDSAPCVDTVTSLTLDGDIKTKYTDNDLVMSAKLATNQNGNIYLCGVKSNSINVLSQKLKKVRTILQERDGLINPVSVCYNQDKNELYIGMEDNDCLKVFKLQ